MDSLLKSNFVASPLLIESDRDLYWIDTFLKKVFPENQWHYLEKRSHPDWLHADGDKLKMEELRELLYQFRMKPFQSSKRVLSIESFQDCSAHIQNALLKSLEEPLEHWIILLGVRSIFGVLPTIRSRCLYFKDRDYKEIVELNEEEEKFYFSIERKDDFYLYEMQEKIFKDRERFRKLIAKLLRRASSDSYPGAWMELSPVFEESLALLDRNLHPKVVWEKVWSEAI